MRKNTPKNFLFFGITAVILATLACGKFQIGILTETTEGESQDIQEMQPEVESSEVEVVAEQGEESTTIAATEEIPIAPTGISVVAWLGHIASLPESSQYDDMVVLSPEGVGEFGLTGSTPEIEAEIRTLRSAAGPNEYVYFWGTLNCSDEVDDYNDCQLAVRKLQYGANYSEEAVTGWIGTIKSAIFNSGMSYVFELVGQYPMWYSIYASQDEAMQAQIESLRDTGAVVRLNAKLMVGIPDVNGTRLEVTSLEILEPGTQEQPEMELSLDIPSEWPVFINDRYSYQVRYPMDGVLSFFGPSGFATEDKPADMTPDLHGEMFRVELPDGTVIRYGSQPRQDATYQDYLMKTKETLLIIISTYQSIP